MPADRFETPCLLLDKAILERNCAVMRARADELGVRFRPHVKTHKSVDVALVAKAGKRRGITVSTLAEAEHFAAHGFDDILYAVPIAPDKLARAAALHDKLDDGLIIAVAAHDAACAIARFAEDRKAALKVAIEIDCGDHRTGVPPHSDELILIADVLANAGGVELAGVFTHAGQSYGVVGAEAIEAVARDERDAVVAAAERLRAAGFACKMVSVGATPTAMFAKDLTGVTEIRPGVYAFQDLDQAARGVCAVEDIALSVLATVVSHHHDPDRIALDAGGLALSKDLGANDRWSDAHYGYLCDAASGERLAGLAVDRVSQEHGLVMLDEPSWFARLPIGARVRILPNHACFTAAAHDRYNLVEGGVPAGVWMRVNGWTSVAG